MTLFLSIRHAFSRLFVPKNRSQMEKIELQHYDNSDLHSLKWINMLGRTVCLKDSSELGKIEAINEENVVVKKRSIEATRYYFSPSMLEKQDTGHFIIDLTSSESLLYERSTVPNPSYYVTLGCSFGYMQTDEK